MAIIHKNFELYSSFYFKTVIVSQKNVLEGIVFIVVKRASKKYLTDYVCGANL